MATITHVLDVIGEIHMHLNIFEIKLNYTVIEDNEQKDMREQIC